MLKRSIVALIVAVVVLGGIAVLGGDDDEIRHASAAEGEADHGGETESGESEEEEENADESVYVEEVSPEELVLAYDAPDDPLDDLDAYREYDLYEEEHLTECDEDADCLGTDQCVSSESINCLHRDVCDEHGHCALATELGHSLPERFCTAVDPDTGETDYSRVCLPGGDAHCQQSRICRENGACQAATYLHTMRQSTHTSIVGPRCFPDPEGCANSEVCEEYGRCGYKSWYGGIRCTPKADLHCRQSEICRRFGHCAQWGASTLVCAATEEAHCEQSEACRLEGKCSLTDRSDGALRHPTESMCRPASDADCQGSEVCEREGRCFAEDGRCVTEAE